RTLSIAVEANEPGPDCARQGVPDRLFSARPQVFSDDALAGFHCSATRLGHLGGKARLHRLASIMRNPLGSHGALRGRADVPPMALAAVPLHPIEFAFGAGVRRHRPVGLDAKGMARS